MHKKTECHINKPHVFERIVKRQLYGGLRRYLDYVCAVTLEERTHCACATGGAGSRTVGGRGAASPPTSIVREGAGKCEWQGWGQKDEPVAGGPRPTCLSPHFPHPPPRPAARQSRSRPVWFPPTLCRHLADSLLYREPSLAILYLEQHLQPVHWGRGCSAHRPSHTCTQWSSKEAAS